MRIIFTKGINCDDMSSIDIFLINETKLDASFPSNQFAMSGYKFVRKDRNKFGGGIAFYINEK